MSSRKATGTRRSTTSSGSLGPHACSSGSNALQCGQLYQKKSTTSTLGGGASTATGRASVRYSRPSSGARACATAARGVASATAAPRENSRRFICTPSLALHAHQRAFDAACLELFLLAVGFFLLFVRPHANAEHLAPGLLALGHLRIQPHQRELGALGFGVFRRAE